MRMRRKPNLAGRIERNAHLIIAEPEALRGIWKSHYGFEDLHIEIGCGKGLFTVETAKNTSNALLVALEKTSNVIVIALERVESTGIKNVKFINGYADDLLSFFASGEVSRIYINFCDPWPANRHKKRRLTGLCFLELYRHVLCNGGEIHFKTDDLPLFEFSLQEFKRCGFTLSEISYNLHEHEVTGVMTDYEAKFHELGKKIFRCVAVNCNI